VGGRGGERGGVETTVKATTELESGGRDKKERIKDF